MYRLDVFAIQLPPLRQHPEDIAQIAEGLLTQLCGKYQRARPSLRAPDVESLQSHTFPGNVRELRNLLERSLLRASPSARELALDLAWLKGRQQVTAPPVIQTETIFVKPAHRQLSPIEQQEYDLIANALRNEGGIRRTAAKVGLTPQALLRRLQKWPELRPVTTELEQSQTC